jgi:hypothetical protein
MTLARTNVQVLGTMGIFRRTLRLRKRATGMRNRTRVTGMRNRTRVTGMRNRTRVTGMRNRTEASAMIWNTTEHFVQKNRTALKHVT